MIDKDFIADEVTQYRQRHCYSGTKLLDSMIASKILKDKHGQCIYYIYDWLEEHATEVFNIKEIRLPSLK